MGAMASQITSLTIVYSTVYSGADQRKHQSSASLAFVRGIHRWPVNCPHKGPVSGICFHLMTSLWPNFHLTWDTQHCISLESHCVLKAPHYIYTFGSGIAWWEASSLRTHASDWHGTAINNRGFVMSSSDRISGDQPACGTNASYLASSKQKSLHHVNELVSNMFRQNIIKFPVKCDTTAVQLRPISIVSSVIIWHTTFLNAFVWK